MKIAIIGGGISGLAAAHRLISRAPADTLSVTLLEASPRFGGWIRTEQFAGRPVDFGPDSLLVRTPWAVELCRELGLEQELVAPGGGGSRILRDGKLLPLPPGILAGLPDGPLPFVRSGLMSKRGIARAALDLVLPANAPPGDESVGALIRRRLGAEALERVIDPLLGGVHAGRCDDLSVAATAPQIAAAARADRSLLRGLRKTAPPRPPAGSPPSPIFMAPRDGMQQLVEALLGALDGRVELRPGSAVTALAAADGALQDAGGTAGAGPAATTAGPAGTGVLVTVDGGEPEHFDGVVLAVAAPAAAALLAPHAPAAAQTLSGLEYASVSHNAFAYDPADVPELPPGTGFLIPRPEGTLMTACTFLDQKWPQRTRDGRGDGSVVIRCSAGRIDDVRFLALTDEELTQTLHRELVQLLGLRGEPLQTRVVRVRGGLPQYRPGHGERIDAAATEVAAALPALALAGAAYRGTSVPVCIREGRAAADDQLARLLPSVTT